MRIHTEIRESAIAAGNKDPYPRYVGHRKRAASRGIGFTLTFDQWWEIWEPHWAKRGQGSLGMCMCRTADKGGYDMGNVRIATNKENAHEYALEFRTKHAQRRYRYSKSLKSLGYAAMKLPMGNHAFQEYSEDFENNDENA